jgi:hypothetical protein
MPTQVQLRRGTTAEHSSFTGAAGEVTVDTTKKTVVVHDGSTAGGMPLLPKTMSDGTANGVAYLNGSKVLTTGSAMQFDGNNFGLGGTPNGYGSAYTVLTINNATTGAVLDLNVNGTRTGALFATALETRLSSITSIPLVFYTGNAERARIDTSGNLIVGSTGTAGSRVSFGTQFIGNNGYANAIRFYDDGSAGTSQSSNSYGLGFINNAALSYSAGTSGSHVWFTNNTERARINSSGNFLVGQASWDFANNGTQIAATGRIFNTSSTDYNLELAGAQGGRVRFYTSAGGVGTTVGSITVGTSSTAYNTSSDYRLKQDIAPMTGALAKVAALRPVTYKWKLDGSASEGFIAHELAAVVPQCVTGEKDAMRTEQYQVGTQKVTKTRQVTDLRIEEREEIVLVDGKRVLRMVEHEVSVPLFEEVPLYNEDGSVATVTVQAVLDEEGNVVTPETTVPRTMQVPVMQEYEEDEPVMGERVVPDYQGIDTSFLVATLTAAIQELKAEFDAYKASHP